MSVDEALEIIYSKGEYSGAFMQFLVEQGVAEEAEEKGLLEISAVLYAQGILEK